MKHFGDITKLSGYTLPVVDVITGGSPCQDLSVAGKRKGLYGERSGLFMEQIRIVKEMRAHDRRTNGRSDVTCRPRYMVWENVPGAFSSNGGRDFQAVLTEIVRIADPYAPDVPLFGGGGRKKWDKYGLLYDEMGRWSIAWRVHDAQFWGVPQRRKRIALIADFGGLTAGEILFERKGMSRDFAQSGEAGETVTGSTGKGVTAAGKCLNTWYVQSKHIQPEDGVAEALYSGEKTWGGGMSHVMTEPKLMDAYQHHGYRQSETCNPLTRDQNNNVRGDTPLVCYGISSYESNAMKSSNPNSGVYEADTARTLDNNGGNPACNQGGVAVVCIEGNGTMESHRGGGYRESETMYTLNSTEQHAVYRQTDHPCRTGTRRSQCRDRERDSEHIDKQDGNRWKQCDRVVGALNAVDYKGAGQQYVDQGKLIY